MKREKLTKEQIAELIINALITIIWGTAVIMALAAVIDAIQR